jgi:hypothetical protein
MAWDYSFEIGENTFLFRWYIHGTCHVYHSVYVYPWYIHGIYPHPESFHGIPDNPRRLTNHSKSSSESPALCFAAASSIRRSKTVSELTQDCHCSVSAHTVTANIRLFSRYRQRAAGLHHHASLLNSSLKQGLHLETAKTRCRIAPTQAVIIGFRSCGLRQFRLSLIDNA